MKIADEKLMENSNGVKHHCIIKKKERFFALIMEILTH